MQKKPGRAGDFYLCCGFALMKREMTIHSESRQHSIEISLDGGAPGKAQAAIDGVPEEVDWVEVEPGVYSLISATKSYTVSVRRTPAPGALGGKQDRYAVSIAGREIPIDVADPRSRRSSATAAAHNGPTEIVAPMPGRIAKLLAPVGSAVEKGTGLVVIEAMKMQNEIRAPRSGKVAEVYVREGDGVELGARLIRLD